MAASHTVLAKVLKPGVARMVYAHPVVQKNSVVLNNSNIINADPGQLVKIVLKRMSSGKRMIVSCTQVTVGSIEEFINLITPATLTHQSQKQHDIDSSTVTYNFDGTEDRAYVVDRGFPRFNGDSPAAKEANEALASTDGFMTYGEVLVPEALVRTLRAIKAISSESSANVLIVGSSGNGKTSLARSIASENKLGFVKVNCATVRDPEEWFGTREARDGSTLFVETEFTAAVRAGNHVILLDEFNRLESYLHNALYPLLDESRRTTVHGNEIVVGEGTIFVCTMNVGNDFTGTFILDAAMKNRMDVTITMGSLTTEREIELLIERVGVKKEDARRVVSMLSRVRDAAIRNEIAVDVSHRSALKIARLVNTGEITIREALTLVIFNNADSPEQSKVLMDSLMGHGG